MIELSCAMAQADEARISNRHVLSIAQNPSEMLQLPYRKIIVMGKEEKLEDRSQKER